MIEFEDNDDTVFLFLPFDIFMTISYENAQGEKKNLWFLCEAEIKCTSHTFPRRLFSFLHCQNENPLAPQVSWYIPVCLSFQACLAR